MELDDVISAWTRGQDKEAVMSLMCEAGVPCGAVLTTEDIVNDEIYRKTGTIVKVNHPVLGEHNTLGTLFHMSDSTFEIAPSPMLGQNTDEVYMQLLNMTEKEIAALKEENVI